MSSTVRRDHRGRLIAAEEPALTPLPLATDDDVLPEREEDGTKQDLEPTVAAPLPAEIDFINNKTVASALTEEVPKRSPSQQEKVVKPPPAEPQTIPEMQMDDEEIEIELDSNASDEEKQERSLQSSTGVIVDEDGEAALTQIPSFAASSVASTLSESWAGNGKGGRRSSWFPKLKRKSKNHKRQHEKVMEKDGVRELLKETEDQQAADSRAVVLAAAAAVATPAAIASSNREDVGKMEVPQETKSESLSPAGPSSGGIQSEELEVSSPSVPVSAAAVAASTAAANATATGGGSASNAEDNASSKKTQRIKNTTRKPKKQQSSSDSGGLLGSLSFATAAAALGLSSNDYGDITGDAGGARQTSSTCCVELMMDDDEGEEPATKEIKTEDYEQMFGGGAAAAVGAAAATNLASSNATDEQQQTGEAIEIDNIKNVDDGSVGIRPVPQVSAPTPTISSPAGKQSMGEGDTSMESSDSDEDNIVRLRHDLGGDDAILARIMSRDDDDDHPDYVMSAKKIVEDKDDDSESVIKRCGRRLNRRRWETSILVVLLILAVITMIILGVSNSKNKKQNEVAAAAGGSASGSGDGSNAADTVTSTGNEDEDTIGDGTTGSDIVAVPEPDPTSAHITTAQGTFEFGQDIQLWFSVGEDDAPQVDDWIAIYGLDMYYFTYLYTCGTPLPCSEDELTGNGYVVFNEKSVIEVGSFWPLPPGLYEAYLYRGDLPPYETLAQSASFVIEEGPAGVATPEPNPEPSSPPSMLPTLSDPSEIAQIVTQAAANIRNLIDDENELGPKFVRLGFHDCIGGCDGCVDMANPRNAGLQVPIGALADIVDEFEGALSRADIWVLAALVGAQNAQALSVEDILDSNNDLEEEDIFQADFSMEWTGRLNCEDREPDGLCFNEDGEEVNCGPRRGPHRFFPDSAITTRELFQFFDDEFGFDVQESVALMGAHTLGELSTDNSGFDGPNGWVEEKEFLDNEYYRQLIGGESPDDPIEVLVETAPLWARQIERDFQGVEGQDEMVWRAFPDGRPIVMLTVDIAIVRDINEDNLDEDGFVSCSFTTEILRPESNSTVCPFAQESFGFATDYKFDNDLWLHDFEIVYKKMLNHGYTPKSDLCPVNNPFHPRCPRR